MSSEPSTAAWLAAFADDLATVGFSERRVDALLAVALAEVLKDNNIRLVEN